MEITLNKAEQRLAIFVAKCRHAANRREGVRDEKVGPQSAEQTDIEGIAAEIAYCKLMNIYPDLETGKGRPKADALLPNGQSVDVKATRYTNGKLLARPGKKDKPSDCYALMIGTIPTYRLAGHMSAADLLDDKRLIDLGYGPTYAAEQVELKKGTL